LLSNKRRGARRCRREDGIDAGKQFEHFLTVPAAKFMRFDDQRGRHHRTRDQTIAHRRVIISRTAAQAIEMQTGPLACGDEERCRARALCLWNIDVALNAKRNRYAVDCLQRLCAARFKVSTGDRDAQPRGASPEQRSDRLHGTVDTSRVVGIETLQIS
jgi:hypothetical protein